jgi:hypothetical protein
LTVTLHSFPRIAAVALAVAVAVPAVAKNQCTAQSGSQTATVLELYTSEGCSSCPPADRWVSSLSQAGFTSAQVVPLAFHVDYWDYIGWKDRFASADYSARQHDLTRRNGSRTVYTPQVFVNGKDTRLRLNNTKLAGDLRAINATKPRADIALALERADPHTLAISGNAATVESRDAKSAQLFLAVYENRLGSEVKAGENSGARLEHDYVVREFAGPLPFDASGKLELRHAFALKPDWKANDIGVAAFVQNRESGEILQAVQLPLCAPED